MSGVVIDIESRKGSVDKDLADINRYLKAISASAAASSRSLNGLLKNNFKAMRNGANSVVNSFKNLDNASGKTHKNLQKQTANTTRETNALSNSLGNMFKVLTIGSSLTFYYKFGDELVNVQNKLKLVVKETESLVGTQKELYKIGVNARSNLTDTASVYFSFSRALRDSGKTQQDFFNVTETIQKSIAISGTTADSARAALLQLSQGLSSGTLRGEELNSVLEQIPRVGESLRKSLNMNVGELRKFAEAGLLTTDVVFKALEEDAATVRKEFGKTTGTAAQGVQRLAGSIKNAVGSLNLFRKSSENFYKVADNIATFFDFLTDNGGIAIDTFTIKARNFVDSMTAIGAASFVLERLARFELSLFDIEAIKEEYDVFRYLVEKIGDLKKRISERAKIDLVPTDTSTIFEFFANVMRAGIALTTIPVAFAEKFKKIIPEIRFPVTEIFARVYVDAAASTANIYGMFLGEVQSLSSTTRGVLEAFTGYLISDTEIERAFAAIFNARSLNVFVTRVYDLKEAIESIRFGNWVVFFKDFYVFFRSVREDIREVLYFFNILDNRLIFINNIRFDRVNEGLQILLSTLDNIYRRVAKPILLEKVVPKYYEYLGTVLAFRDALNDSLNVEYGEEIGRDFFKAILDGIRSLVSGFRSAGKDLDITKYLNFGTLARSLIDIFTAIGSFVIGFFKGIGKAGVEEFGISFEKTVKKVSNYAKKLKEDALETVKEFTEEVSRLFFITYDKVVGNSYWPDLVDEVIAKTTDLSKAGGYVSKFLAFVGNEFKKLDERYGITTAIKRITERISKYFEKIDFKAIGASLQKNLNALLVSGFILKFSENGKLRFLAKGYLVSLITSLNPEAAAAAMKPVAERVVDGFITIIIVAVKGLVKELDAVIEKIPEIFGTLVDRLSGFDNVFSKLFSAIPASGLLFTLIVGTALGGMFGGSGVRGFIGNILREAFTIITTLFVTFRGNLAAYLGRPVAGAPLWAIYLGNLFGNANWGVVAAGFGILATAVLDSVSIIEAALLGIPLILSGLFGPQTTGRFLANLSTLFMAASRTVLDFTIFVARVVWLNMLPVVQNMLLVLQGLFISGFVRLQAIVSTALLNIRSIIASTVAAMVGLLRVLKIEIAIALGIFGVLFSGIASAAGGSSSALDGLSGLSKEIIGLTTNILLAVAAYKTLRFYALLKTAGSAAAIAYLTGSFKALRDVVLGLGIVMVRAFSSLPTAIASTYAAVAGSTVWAKLGAFMVATGSLLGRLFTLAFTGAINLGFAALGLVFRGLVGTITALFAGAGLWANLKRLLIAGFKGVLAAGTTALLAVSGLTLFGGLLSVWLFGKGDSFFDKLDYAKDKLLEFVGFGEALVPRMKKLMQALKVEPPEKLPGVDFTTEVKNIDVESMRKAEYDFLLETIEAAEGLNERMNKYYRLNKSYSKELLDEYEESQNNIRTLIDRAPKNSYNGGINEVFQKAAEDLKKQENSITAVLLKLQKLSYGLLKNILPDSADVNVELSEILPQNDFWARFKEYGKAAAANFGTQLEKRLDEISKKDFLESSADLLSKAGKGLEFPSVEKDWDKDGLETSYRLMNPLAAGLAKAFTTVLPGTLVDIFKMTDLGAYLFPGLDGKLKERIEELQNTRITNPTFVSKSEKETLFALLAKETALKDQLEKANLRAVRLTGKESEQLRVLGVNYQLAQSNAKKYVEEIEKRTTERKAVADFRAMFADLKKSGESINLENIRFFGEDDKMRLAVLKNEVDTLNAKLRDTSENGINSLVDRQAAERDLAFLKKLVERFSEELGAKESFVAELNFTVKESGLDIASEQISKFFVENKRGYEEFAANASLYRSAVERLGSVSLLGKTPEEREAEFQRYTQFYYELQQARERMLKSAPKSDLFSEMNKALQSIGLEQLNINQGLKLNSAQQEEINSQLAIAVKAKEALDRLPANSPWEKIVEAMKKVVEAARAAQAAVVEALRTPTQSVMEAAGVDIVSASKKAGNKNVLAKSERLLAFKSALELDLPDNVRKIYGEQASILEKQLSKAFEEEEIGKTLEERFSKYAEKLGINIDLKTYVKLQNPDRNELLGKAAQIKKQLDGAGDAFLTRPAWVKQQLKDLEAIQEKVDSLADESFNSLEFALESLNSLGLDVDYEKMFSLSGTVIDGYVQLRRELIELEKSFSKTNLKEKERIFLQNRYLELKRQERALAVENMPGEDLMSAVTERLGNIQSPERFVERLGTNVKEELKNQIAELSRLKEDYRTLPESIAKVALSDIKEKEKLLTAKLETLILPYMSFGERLAYQIERTGIAVDKGLANLLGADVAPKISKYLKQFADAKALLDKGGLDEAGKKAAQLMKDAAVESLNKEIEKRKVPASVAFGKGAAEQTFKGIQTGLKDVLASKQSLEDFAKAFIDSLTLTIIDAFVEGLTNPIEDRVKGVFEELFTGIFAGSEDMTGDNRGIINPLQTWFDDTLEVVNQFGENLFNTFADMSDSILTVFTGTEDQPGLVSRIMESFGLADMGFGSGDFGSVEGASTIMSGGVSTTTGGGASEETSLLGNIWGAITEGFGLAQGLFGSLISGVMSIFGIQTMMQLTPQMEMAYYGAILSGITSLLAAILARVSIDNPAFASGGFVSGSGTGTSDSITAMLSNGEYVVNAKQTAKYRPLLEAINENRIPAFADGGAVGKLADITAASIIPQNKEKSQQVFNISITGDISRQTKREIYTMLPEIANGVNSYNREVGYRG